MVCLIVLAVGCQKENPTPTASAATNVSTETESAAAPEQDLSATLTQLTQAVRRYAAEQQKAPKDLQEVAAAGYVAGVPAAPPGKHFAISKKLEVYVSGH